MSGTDQPDAPGPGAFSTVATQFHDLCAQLDLGGQSILVLDAEIEHCVPERGEARFPELVYAKDWHDYEGMGVAVVAAYDFQESRTRVFLEDNRDDLQDLAFLRDTIVTFNGKGFDLPLLSVCWNLELDLRATKPYGGHVDLCAMVRDALGYRLKLAQLLAANGIPAKTGDGARAPVLWQHGYKGEVIDYCAADVHRTASLFLRACLGPLTAPDGTLIDLDLTPFPLLHE